VALGAPLVVLGLGLLVLAPLVGRAVSLVVGRHREMDADGAGVSLTRYPPGLVAALEKLTGDAAAVTSASRATAHLWIASPLARTPSGGLEAWLDRRFDTHLPLEERIAALREL
jgi:heat shock protein HtpX